MNDEGIRAIDQDEHNGDAHAKRVLLKGQDPGTGSWVNIAAVDNGDGTYSIKSNGPKLKTLIDKTTTTNVIYIGKAAIGTATSSAAWQISKVDKTGTPISITYAASGASTATWNNRASEVYS